MKQLLKENKYFLIPYLVSLLVCAGLLFTFPKTELHIFSNKANSVFFDYFFKYATNLGDGAMIALLIIALLFVKYRYAFAFLSGSLLTAGLINLLKNILGDIFRPSKYFELYETYQLHFVEGVKLHYLHSFPSGHTGTAFNLFFMLALIAPNRWAKLLLFFGAVIVGYSRVYLSQHFLIDITIGSLIGTTIMFLVFFLFSEWDKTWLNKSLIHGK